MTLLPFQSQFIYRLMYISNNVFRKFVTDYCTICCVSLDPTAGPSAADHSKWCLDESALHENIKKMLVRFCGPSPLVFSDVNALYLANTAPPTAAEW